MAEDDLSTNWFLSGVFREAGATVSDAFDGEQALDRIYRKPPDLVVSDVVMPGIDGFALCRALKRDVVLRSVPVLLLSLLSYYTISSTEHGIRKKCKKNACLFSRLTGRVFLGGLAAPEACSLLTRSKEESRCLGLTMCGLGNHVSHRVATVGHLS